MPGCERATGAVARKIWRNLKGSEVSEYTEEYSLVDVQRGDIENIELANSFHALAPEEPVECYRVQFRGERAQNSGGIAGEMIFFPHRAQAGIAWGGETVWFDASSATEAVERYLDHDFGEDNNSAVRF